LTMSKRDYYSVRTGKISNIAKQSFGYGADFEVFTSKPYAPEPHTMCPITESN
jgi:hypothetical protein